MTGWNEADAALPPSHVFVTVAHGRAQKTVAVSRWASVLILAVLATAGLWLVGATIYVVGHDSLLAALMRRERDLQFDYEDRVAALQRELDRSASQQAQLQRTVETKLDALTAQEAELRQKASAVAGLADHLLHVAGRPPAAERQATIAQPTATAEPASRAPRRDSAIALVHEGELEPRQNRRQPERVASLANGFDDIASQQQADLSRLQAVVDDRLARYRDALSQAGLTMGRFVRQGEASGGPFVPLESQGGRSPFDRATLLLGAAVSETERMQGLAAHIPFAKPLEGTPEVTSPFGARTDPFLGRPALHTGIDLSQETGTEVLATAAGRVSFAGAASGYGTMVEIDHGAGLSTRYAHLSAALVTVGQSVTAAEAVGLVGATGRATGPHLHYETRIDDEPVDPMRFLIAGHGLADLSPGP